MKVKELKIEYRKNQIGLDERAPRFFWKIECDEKYVMQSAYDQTINELAAYMPAEGMELFKTVINKLNEIEKEVL